MIWWSNEADVDNKWPSDLMKLILISNDLWSNNEVDIDNIWSNDLMKLILMQNDLVI